MHINILIIDYRQLSMSVEGTDDFDLSDPLYYLRTGVEAIVDDEVTKRFSAEELHVSEYVSKFLPTIPTFAVREITSLGIMGKRGCPT